MKSEIRKEWSESFGQFLASISKFYALISYVFSSMGIGCEIIPWLKTEEGQKGAESAIRSLGEVFLSKKRKNFHSERDSVSESNDPKIGKYLTTVRLGEYPNMTALIREAMVNDKLVNAYAYRILMGANTSPEVLDLDIWEVDVSELIPEVRHGRSVYWETLFLDAHKYGFDLCSAEAAILFFLNYEHCFNYNVAMLPIELNLGYQYETGLAIQSQDNGFVLGTWDGGQTIREKRVEIRSYPKLLLTVPHK